MKIRKCAILGAPRVRHLPLDISENGRPLKGLNQVRGAFLFPRPLARNAAHGKPASRGCDISTGKSGRGEIALPWRETIRY
jgi:hypothetical protein